MTKTLSVRMLCLSALFTAIIAVMAQIQIPMPYGVPITLQTFAIALAGVVLGARLAAISTLTYLLLGAVGLPIFTSFMGGLGVILGPTGGFLLSFPLLAYFCGLGANRSRRVMWLCLAMGTAVSYLIGLSYFVLVMNSNFTVAFTACMLPFLPGDGIKLVLAGISGTKIRKALKAGGIQV